MLHFIIIIISCIIYGIYTVPAESIKGVNWVGSSQITESSLNSLDRIYANWIIQTPFAWQKAYDRPDLRLHTSGRILWGESDEGIRLTSKFAKKKKLKIMLKPHIWLTDYSGKWRSDIKMQSEKDWELWFKNYEEMILHYARLAEDLKLDALCIGTELYQTILLQNEKWLKLIAKIKKEYSGKLTYAANWYEEYERVQFWDQLDFIGVQAYFPLGSKENPSVIDMNQAWKKYDKKMSALSDSLSKKIIFTELGYKNMIGATMRPWEWPEQISEHIIDEDIQSRAFQSFFESCWKKDWLAGVFIWKWYPHEKRINKNKLDFSPQKRKAEATIKTWFKNN